ncbi:UxaA family hydrolase [Sphingomonas sp. 37zxx]|uniref:UxaA family hydrolase n=1 Tax=Sphingomonas sp. 37zxx TaxID=1550073 RepID=UPI00053BE7EB|nr:altronate dehydratase family protein [Sphingomonas sp. 37zxx]
MTDPIRLHRDDNVAVTLHATPLVPALHKVAVRAIAPGQAILKYGQPIGIATRDIAAGEHVHVHNCAMADMDRDYRFGLDAPAAVTVADADRATFQGFVRANGQVGTRNYIAIISSVNCSATVAHAIAQHFARTGLAEYPQVDGVAAFTYSGGCSIAPGGEAFRVIERTLAGYAASPNVAAVLMLGLGCEAMQVERVKADFALTEGEAFQSFSIQDHGGTRKAVAEGIARVEAMLPIANRAVRTTVPASALTLGLQCGGSDALSGITANPALGIAVDHLVAQGGTAILSETTELYGAEHLLTARAASPAIGQALLDRLEWWKDYTARNGETIDSNPSPGNKAGGITTILEKSLGAQMKGGSSVLNGVFGYAEPITARGLVIMDSPGYDPASATGQVASGANLIAFTTGRGSAFGSKPVPTLKIATNTAMFQRMRDDMDLNCGDIVDGGSTIEAKGREIFNALLAAASGRPTASEELGYGDHEFVPWNVGATT